MRLSSFRAQHFLLIAARFDHSIVKFQVTLEAIPVPIPLLVAIALVIVVVG